MKPGITVNESVRAFLENTDWRGSDCVPISGDASPRKYFRLRGWGASAVLMDASMNLESVAPFIRINLHLQHLGFSAPAILARDEEAGLLLLEDFGDDTFSSLLENQAGPEKLFALAIDVLVALHKHPGALAAGLQSYHPERMLDDIELFLEWQNPPVSAAARAQFRSVWREVLPLAHRVPASLLLRDFHAANLMWLPGREGIRQAGLLDFQDAYQGPVTYDLVSLLEDARRDVPDSLKGKMLARYHARFSTLDRESFETSLAVVAAQRHTRVLAIFERLSRRDGKHDYRSLHSPRVRRHLQRALRHPALERVKGWMEHYAG